MERLKVLAATLSSRMSDPHLTSACIDFLTHREPALLGGLSLESHLPSLTPTLFHPVSSHTLHLGTFIHSCL